MKRGLICATALVLLGAATVCGQQGHRGGAHRAAQESRDAAAVRAVLEAQAAAWNRGDIEAYMDGYARSDETTFVSGDSVMRGWQAVLDRYKARYDTRAKMGTLTFSELDIEPLGPAHMLVTGRWQLARAGDAPHGRFTLIFRRTPAGWRIVHDHTSSAAS